MQDEGAAKAALASVTRTHGSGIDGPTDGPLFKGHDFAGIQVHFSDLLHLPLDDGPDIRSAYPDLIRIRPDHDDIV